MKSINIEPFSAAVSPIDMYFDNTYLSRGSAFFWEEANRTFLITNWHNVSGKNPLTKKHLSETAAEPNIIKFDMFKNGDVNSRRTFCMKLFHGRNPAWLEHPVHRSAIDVVCLEINPYGYSVFPINNIANSDIKVRVGNDVFILGYPMGIDTHRFPVWKRGSVATEIDIDVDGLPKFYVDTASSRGMSGAPVIRHSSSGQTEDGTFVIGQKGVMSRVVGIYSGRLSPKDKQEAQLGIVWKTHVISEIISGGCIGCSG